MSKERIIMSDNTKWKFMEAVLLAVANDIIDGNDMVEIMRICTDALDKGSEANESDESDETDDEEDDI